MALRIDRKKDQRVTKCVLHRVADISGGVTISVAHLGGTALLEGTPIGKGEDGLFVVCKTAKVLTQAENNATTYDVAKGHHFKIGDHFAVSGANGQTITGIDKSDASKDVITIEATLGKAIKAGECAFESKGKNQDLKVTPIAITGSNENVDNRDNVFSSAWVIGVVRQENAPAVNDVIKTALKGVVYV